MIRYQEIGLVNTRKMLEKAYAERYAIPGYCFHNLEQLQAIIIACVESKSPVVLQVRCANGRTNTESLKHFLSPGMVEMAGLLGRKIPIALHLEGGDSYDLCVSCMENGFSSVMIDGSRMSFEDNIALTKRVVVYAHDHQVTVEGKLSLPVIKMLRGARHHEMDALLDMVVDFAGMTMIDSLGISAGEPEDEQESSGKLPLLWFRIFNELERRMPGFPLVLDGASPVIPGCVQPAAGSSGKSACATAVPDDYLNRAARTCVCKISMESDTRPSPAARIRERLYVDPKKFDPWKHARPARDEIISMIRHKNTNVLCSSGRA